MSSADKFLEGLVGTLLTFKTPRLVRVRSLKIGLIFRFVQIAILSYVIGYAVIYKKGYQETEDSVQSSVTAKVKGIASTNDRWDLKPPYRRVWDPADYIVPPQENGAFFVMTSAVITSDQTQSKCPESPYTSPCTQLSDNTTECPKGDIPSAGSGIMTGRCVHAGGPHHSCEISGWCPVENDETTNETMPLLPQAANFTVLIKNNIEFPKFHVKRNNIPSYANKTYLRGCQYDRETDPLCPVFRLGYMTDEAKVDFDSLALRGGVINIGIEWNCNLDLSLSRCVPKYKFSRLDDPTSSIASGWNFRYANYYRKGNKVARDLIKAYGILFIFTVNGKGGKFSIVPLIVNIGAGLAFLGVATLACDFILLYIVKKRSSYQEHKFLEVMDEDFKKIGGHHDDVENNANSGKRPPSMETSQHSAVFTFEPENEKEPGALRRTSTSTSTPKI